MEQICVEAHWPPRSAKVSFIRIDAVLITKGYLTRYLVTQIIDIVDKYLWIAQKNSKNPTDVALNNALSARNVLG